MARPPDRIAGAGSALRDVFAQTPIPGWPGMNRLVVSDGCRYWCFLYGGSTGASVAAEVSTDDTQRTCLQIADQLVAQGWTDRWQAPNTDWCTVSLHKPAPLSRVYVIELNISPDDGRPTVDPAHTAVPGRVFTRPRAVSTFVRRDS